MNKTSELALANKALREKRYEEAISHYKRAAQNSSWLEKIVAFNLNLARRKLLEVHGEIGEQGSHEEPERGLCLEWIKQIRPHFDHDYYLAQYPDIAKAGIDPVKHYCSQGWREGRNPHPDFSTTYYLETNPDVAEAGVNPYWHYVVAGRAEGRSVQHPGGYKAEILKNLLPLERIVKLWEKTGPLPSVLDTDELYAKIVGALDGGISSLIIGLGHDHYRKVSGGIQLCIQREEEAAPRFGALYLNVHPWQPLPRLAKPEDDLDPVMCLILSGIDIGNCRMSALIAMIRQFGEISDDIHVVIHSLLGHMPEQVVELVQSTGKKSCWLWLHDFFTLCPSYSLQRNTIMFCGAPEQSSNACNLCVFGTERPSHQLRISALFESLEIHVISPSSVTREFWESKTDVPYASVTVVPHMQLSWERRENKHTEESKGVVTLAFIGAPVPHKGWQVFKQLVQELQGSKLYRFVYFGNHDISLAGVERFHVHVTSGNYAAMIEAISECEVDIVLHWAACRETFSFSTYEALAGGAYVITNPISGNVAETVRRLGRGAVLADEQELVYFFNSGQAMQLAMECRKARQEFEILHSLSEMTLPFLAKENA